LQSFRDSADAFENAMTKDHMIPEITASPFRTAAAALGLALLAYASIATFLYDGRDRLPADATSIETLPEALKKLSAADRQVLIAAEQNKLAREPLDRAALRNLSYLFAADGQAKRGQELMTAAADSAMRDSIAQANALPVMLEKGDFVRAVKSLDALLRTNPQSGETLYPVVSQLAEQSQSRQQVINVLTTTPPWRLAFLEWLAGKGGRPQTAHDILSGLKATDAPPTGWEVLSLLRHFLSAKDYETAYFMWLDMLSEEKIRKAGNIFDGGFSLPLAPPWLYFSWTATPSASVNINSVPRSTGSTDNVLRIDFVNNRDKVAPMQQFLRLSPGSYVYSGEMRTDNLRAEAPLGWQLYCLEGDRGQISFIETKPKLPTWDRFETRFEVPQGCATQLLTLRISSSATLDQKISGSVFYDNLAIVSSAAQ
jgi:hypothetical protein